MKIDIRFGNQLFFFVNNFNETESNIVLAAQYNILLYISDRRYVQYEFLFSWC